MCCRYPCDGERRRRIYAQHLRSSPRVRVCRAKSPALGGALFLMRHGRCELFYHQDDFNFLGTSSCHKPDRKKTGVGQLGGLCVAAGRGPKICPLLLYLAPLPLLKLTPLLLYLAPLPLLKLIKNPLVHMQSVALFMQECMWMGEAREVGQISLVLYSFRLPSPGVGVDLVLWPYKIHPGKKFSIIFMYLSTPFEA